VISSKGICEPVRVAVVEQESMEFAEFYESARDDCLRIVLLNVGDRQLAEDLVADGFAKAWVSWRKVRSYEAPGAWVVRAALNANVSRWRRHRREVVLDGHDVAVTAEESGALSGELMAALRALPLRQREVVTLRLLLDLDTQTTARLLGIAPGTVGVHLHRAAETLRSALPHLADQEAKK
jgi:RNA polymerase sigma factor (sigma-70 family)